MRLQEDRARAGPMPTRPALRYNVAVPKEHDVYVEAGSRRVFANATEWPGWSRSGRDEEAALEALLAYAPRYAAAIGKAAGRPFAPTAPLRVVERVAGDATTDFGAPSAAVAADERPLDAAETRRLTAILEACWAAFDAAAEAVVGAVLRKGPLGGGRELPAIVEHVADADGAYLARIAGSYRRPEDADAWAAVAGARSALLETLAERANGVPPPENPRRRAPLWTPRYAIRRCAWHPLDHAWEIEDRATPA